MLLQPFNPSLRTPWHWEYGQKTTLVTALLISVHKSGSAYLILWHGSYTQQLHIFCNPTNFPEMPLPSRTHVESQGESYNHETSGTDTVTDIRMGSSSQSMWVEQERPLALAERCPFPPSLGVREPLWSLAESLTGDLLENRVAHEALEPFSVEAWAMH